jgi:hypothetical protein
MAARSRRARDRARDVLGLAPAEPAPTNVEIVERMQQRMRFLEEEVLAVNASLEPSSRTLTVADIERAIAMLRRAPEPPIAELLLRPARGAFRRLLANLTGRAPLLQRVFWRINPPRDILFGAYIGGRRSTAVGLASPAAASLAGIGWNVVLLPRRLEEATRFLDHHGEPPFLELYEIAAREHDARPTVAEIRQRYEASVRDLGAEIVYGAGRRQGRSEGPEMTYHAPHWSECRDYPGHAERRAAEARGEQLLREWLSPEQRAQYERDKCFEVLGSSGGSYRITERDTFNVEQLDREGRCIALLCFVPEGGLVKGDIMLAQKVALETNEPAARKVANRRQEAEPGGFVRHGGIFDWLRGIVP